MQILVLNGPNLNLLGLREPGIYGRVSLAQIADELKNIATNLGADLEFMQSNHEGVLVDRIQECLTTPVDMIIINPAAFTHTSVAIRDALLAVAVPFIEIHLSNVHAREDFRQHSYFSDVAVGVICGLGAYGYQAALNYAINFLKMRK
ncbi:MAG: 3-dehydroquinate dehydratase [Pseudomonadota bacterium]|jgi:3-dehydroquinate dehydratase-2|nr:type II 3-dehydroquinate dehydratase [Burkholderiales bacterium]MBP9768696.1 type II 3-dehydroquinate dehydratase [Burkholderiales bacterium]MDQ5948410.1 3-dehydroquinate dehydratase [Pseudomonadota bacterium]